MTLKISTNLVIESKSVVVWGMGGDGVAEEITKGHVETCIHTSKPIKLHNLYTVYCIYCVAILSQSF